MKFYLSRIYGYAKDTLAKILGVSFHFFVRGLIISHPFKIPSEFSLKNEAEINLATIVWGPIFNLVFLKQDYFMPSL